MTLQPVETLLAAVLVLLLGHLLNRLIPPLAQYNIPAPITGGLLFEMLSDPLPVDPNAPRPRLGVRARTFTGPKRGGGAGKVKTKSKSGKRR